MISPPLEQFVTKLTIPPPLRRYLIFEWPLAIMKIRENMEICHATLPRKTNLQHVLVKFHSVKILRSIFPVLCSIAKLHRSWKFTEALRKTNLQHVLVKFHSVKILRSIFPVLCSIAKLHSSWKFT